MEHAWVTYDATQPLESCAAQHQAKVRVNDAEVLEALTPIKADPFLLMKIKMMIFFQVASHRLGPDPSLLIL